MANTTTNTPRKLATSALFCLSLSNSQAATIAVDGDICSLEDAVISAETDTAVGGCTQGSGNDTLLISDDLTLTGIPPITTNIMFRGDGARRTLESTMFHRLFWVGDESSAPTVSFENLKLENGNVRGAPGSTLNGGAGAALGGIIFVYDGNVDIDDVEFTGGVIGGAGNSGTSNVGGDGGGGLGAAGGHQSTDGSSATLPAIGGGGGGGGFSSIDGGHGGSNGGAGGHSGGSGPHAGVSFGGGGGGGAGGAANGEDGQDGAAGAFGGGGGGGGRSHISGSGTGGSGGPGGFGGGGGGGGAGSGAGGMGGLGGFGGGGGGGGGQFGTPSGAGAVGGLHGGDGTTTSSGGGAALGGAIFIRTGHVSIRRSLFQSNVAQGGPGAGGGPASGEGKGPAIYALATLDNGNGNNQGFPFNLPVVGGCSNSFVNNLATNPGATDTDNVNVFGVSLSGLQSACVPSTIVPQTPSGANRSLELCPDENDEIVLEFDETGGDTPGTVSCALNFGTVFSLVASEVTVPAGGSATLNINVDAPADGSANTDTLNCSLAGVPGYAVNLAQTNATVPATVSISPTDVVEGDSGVTTANFEATLSNATGCPFSMTFTASDVTTEPDDYDNTGGSAAFAGTAGETQMISVDVNGDVVTELDEVFEVNVTAPTTVPVNISGSPVTGTIVNDDSSILAIQTEPVIAVDEDDTDQDDQLIHGQALVPALLIGAVDIPISVDFETQPGAITAANRDYAYTAGTLQFSGADQEQIEVSVEILANQTYQPVSPPREFSVEFSNLITGGRAVTLMQPPRSVVRVLDNDENPGECADTHYPGVIDFDYVMATAPGTNALVASYETSSRLLDRATLEPVNGGSLALPGQVTAVTVIQRDNGNFRAVHSTTNGFIAMADMHSSSFQLDWFEELSLPGVCTVGIDAPAAYFSRRESPLIDAQFEDDVLVVGTRSSCNDKNQVLALDPDDGSTHWAFNATGASHDLDSVTSLLAEPSTARVFVTTDQRMSSTQSSVWAIDVSNGVKLWDTPAGKIMTAPILKNGRLYVLDLFGVVTALDADNGDVIWTIDLGEAVTPFPIRTATVGSNTELLYVLDFEGTVHAIEDLGAAADLTWETPLTGFAAPGVDPMVFDRAGGWIYISGFGSSIRVVDAADGTDVTTLNYDETQGDNLPNLLALRIPGQDEDSLYITSDGVRRICLGEPQLEPVIGDGASVGIPVEPGETALFDIGFTQDSTRQGSVGANALVTCSLDGDPSFSLVNDSVTVPPSGTASIQVSVAAPIDSSSVNTTLRCVLDDGGLYSLNLATRDPDWLFDSSFE